MAGIYIHIPFCKQPCHYCDFHFTISQRHKVDLVKAICEELKLQSSFIDDPFNSIYFGGGTPSILSKPEIKSILDTVYGNYKMDENIEITLEANPDDLNSGFLSEIHDLGINRLSIGIQTFDNEMLKYLNRAHNSEEANSCIKQARGIGFENINLDLIFALPSQNHQRLKSDLKQLLSYTPEHLSAYCLTIEEKTLFGKWQKQGKLDPIDEGFAAEQFEIVHETLSENNYHHYEISNYALPGLESRHNSNYWRDEKYLGIGPSAHSFNGVSRQYNVRHNSRYMASILKGKVPFILESVNRAERINDYILTSLRTSWGCDCRKLEVEMGYSLQEDNFDFLNSIIEKELAIMSDNVLILTPKGMLMADSIASSLFI